MTYKNIANLIPTMQSIALVSENIKETKKKKIDVKDITKLGVKNIVGLSLIKETASII